MPFASLAIDPTHYIIYDMAIFKNVSKGEIYVEIVKECQAYKEW